MYTYSNIAENFANSFSINKELFNVSLSGEKISNEFFDYEEFEIHAMESNYFYGYQFKQNIEENWQCISFHIKSNNKFEVLNILNNELSKIDNQIISIDDALDQLRLHSEYEFHYFEGDTLLINGIISDDESYISISKPIVVEENIIKKTNRKAIVA